MDTAVEIVGPIRDADDIHELKKHLVSGLSLWRQVVPASLGAGIVGVALALVSGELTKLPIVPESYLGAMLLVFLGVNGAYWLVTMAGFTAKYAGLPSLGLSWVDPAETDGVLHLGSRLGQSAIYGALAIVSGVVPIDIAVNFYSNPVSSPVLGSIRFVVLVVSAVLLFIWAAWPQVALSRRIRRRRSAVLGIVRRSLTEPRSSNDSGSTQLLLDIYVLVRESRQFTIRGDTIVEYGVALATLAIPFAIATF
jgi:hypothetical protein